MVAAARALDAMVRRLQRWAKRHRVVEIAFELHGGAAKVQNRAWLEGEVAHKLRVEREARRLAALRTVASTRLQRWYRGAMRRFRFRAIWYEHKKFLAAKLVQRRFPPPPRRVHGARARARSATERSRARARARRGSRCARAGSRRSARGRGSAG